MTFPVSGVETAIWVPPLVGLAISFFTSMGGISGAFLILPFQVSVRRRHQPGGNADEPGLQCSGHSQRGLAVFSRREDELAAGLEYHSRDISRIIPRNDHKDHPSARSTAVQTLCRLRTFVHRRSNALSGHCSEGPTNCRESC